jgi:hypothetical protein
MNKVYQINIVQAENGFVVQSPTGDQMIASDEAGVQEAVRQLVTKLLNEPEPDKFGRQTIKRFGDPIQGAKKSA